MCRRAESYVPGSATWTGAVVVVGGSVLVVVVVVEVVAGIVAVVVAVVAGGGANDVVLLPTEGADSVALHDASSKTSATSFRMATSCRSELRLRTPAASDF